MMHAAARSRPRLEVASIEEHLPETGIHHDEVPLVQGSAPAGARRMHTRIHVQRGTQATAKTGCGVTLDRVKLALRV